MRAGTAWADGNGDAHDRSMLFSELVMLLREGLEMRAAVNSAAIGRYSVKIYWKFL